MSIKITLADLTYTNQGYPSVSFPFGAALVASYAKKFLGSKYPLNPSMNTKKLKKILKKF